MRKFSAIPFSLAFFIDGTVSKVVDNVTGEVYDYTYDELGNVTEFSATKNGTVERSETVTYDNYGNVSQKSVTGGNTVTYAYKNNAERDLESVANSEWFTSFPSTDKLKRNTGKTVKNGNTAIYTSSISYKTNTVDGVVHATAMPQTVNLNGETFTYEYDSNGNIYQIKKGGVVYNRYLYDSVNRLIREDNRELGTSMRFVYDSNGNMLLTQKVPFTLGELTAWTNHDEYTYSKDKLISFNTNGIVYDSVGNPTSFKGVSLTWGKGKRLVSYGTNTFAYDGQGRRVRKNDITYTYDGANRLISSSNGFEFFYDSEGLAGFTYGGEKYVYQKDLENNIIGIIDKDCMIRVKYMYDAWGKCEVSGLYANTIGTLNPFRFKGYIYDEETGLYLIGSRYYDPETGRFISPADLSSINPTDLQGFNLYSFAINNSIEIAYSSSSVGYGDSGGMVSSLSLGGLFSTGNNLGCSNLFNIIADLNWQQLNFKGLVRDAFISLGEVWYRTAWGLTKDGDAFLDFHYSAYGVNGYTALDNLPSKSAKIFKGIGIGLMALDVIDAGYYSYQNGHSFGQGTLNVGLTVGKNILVYKASTSVATTVGTWAGAKLGAALGAPAGPVGFVIGAFVGVAVGWGIDTFGDVIIDWVVGWFD